MIEVYKISNYNSKIYINEKLHTIPHAIYTLDNLALCLCSIVEEATNEVFGAIFNIIRIKPRVWNISVISKHEIDSCLIGNVDTDLIKENCRRSNISKLKNNKFYYSPPLDSGLMITNLNNPLVQTKLKMNTKYISGEDISKLINSSNIVNVYYKGACIASYLFDKDILFSTMENEIVKREKVHKSLLPSIISLWFILIVIVLLMKFL